MQKIATSIVCSNTMCKYNSGLSCTAAVVEVGWKHNCITYEEIDIYKEVEEFSRDGQAD